MEKDGWFKTNIEDDVSEDTAGLKGDDIFATALSKDNEVEFLSTLSNGVPKDFCKSYLSIKACAKDRYAWEQKKWSARRTLTDFNNVPRVLSDYANYILNDDDIERPKSLIIISPTRYGKTQWARTITENHGYMATEWNVDKINDTCQLMIFDDVPMSELLPRQRWKAFFGMQEEFDITGKYRGSRQIVRGWKGFIFCCNVDPRTEEGVTQATYNS